jgi:hypothetical protein
MALCIPLVIGPVNELMTAVRVQGAVPGATILVSATGPANREVAKGQATGGDDWVPLLPGVKLQAEDLLLASQEHAGDRSPISSPQLGATVAPAPTLADLGYVGALTHLYRCGSAVWLTGAYPGATVNVSWNGVTHGTAVAGPDGARVGLDTGLPAGPVYLSQSTPAGSGPDTVLRTDEVPVDTTRPLLPPTLHQPMIGCQTSILVTDVVEGANVTLTHATGGVETATFDRPGLWFGVQALREQDRITVRQDFGHCELHGAESAPEKVGPPDAIRVPFVPDPLCVGAVSILVGNLVPGALVHITAAGTTYTGMAPAPGAWATFYVAPLPRGTVTAHQELVGCAVTSPESSPPTKIDTKSEAVGPVTIRGPLLACGRAVPVSNAHPGALLQVMAKTANGNTFVSRVVTAGAVDVSIPVTPYLREGDHVRVYQWACAFALTHSTDETVQAHPAPSPPSIGQPTFGGSLQVQAVNVLPGALVDVYVRRGEQWLLVGSGVADSSTPTILIKYPLSVGDQLHATQTLCGTQTEPGPSTTVVIPPPAPPVITFPTQGAVNVPVRPTFTWNDPGKGKDSAAVSYELTVMDASTAVIPMTPVTGTSFTSPRDLTFKWKLTVQIRARNVSGLSGLSQVVFTTQDVPAPVAPVLTNYDTQTHVLTGSGFLKNHSVRVRLSMLNNSVLNQLGQSVPDYRDASANVTSDGAGNIASIVEPSIVLPTLPLQDGYDGASENFAYGALSGETMHVSATDGRASVDKTEVLWSNTLPVYIP